ncbi:DUF2975 domain-containing protein [Christiangramia sp. OXR-203]|jgi:hypothetical protein|uniref:DUF2975 domain-containing protein n=1 Tax=Christiangramia sp. OXR-203 TaxID=3100176 RepID=UPI002AC9D537|nr:DUF2975 domain-containing protein [Christiangramia sp. OXR-203]WPY98479.1 DUF2975 domain-containing protein [Christiangramia sp. OXR-203]
MKPISLLKYSLNVFLISLLAINLLKLLIVLFYFFNPDHDFFGGFSILPDEINNQPITKNYNWTTTLFGIDIISSILFIYLILKFKNLVSLLNTTDLFNFQQQKLFKNIGILLIIYAGIKWISLFIYKNFLESSPRTVTYDFDGTGSFWFVLILGLLFTYISYAFKEARFHREENELTV